MSRVYWYGFSKRTEFQYWTMNSDEEPMPITNRCTGKSAQPSRIELVHWDARTRGVKPSMSWASRDQRSA
jgi:hypothetical protein